jgi:glucans biosynthesis protein
VHLLEMPARDETDDNIAAFWRPALPWQAGQEIKVAYRLTWGSGPPADGLGTVVATRTGKTLNSSDRQFVIDFADLPDDATGLHGVVTASAGAASPVSLIAFPDRAEVRAGFRFTPPASGPADIELRLLGDGGDLSEAWRFRWT